MKGEEGIDYKNCYYANFTEFTKRVNNEPVYHNKNVVLVHAMREWGGKNSELWGGHAFLLDKEQNMIDDYSNQKHISKSKDRLFDVWNIQTKGKFMYFEYNYIQALEMALKTGHYGSWELLFEDWQNKKHAKYMKDYFMPKFQPRLHEMYNEVDEYHKKNRKAV
jgi:hypothetical protein